MKNLGSVLALVAVTACGSGGGGGEPPTDPFPPEQSDSWSVQPIFAGCGTPTVDGVLSPGEWEGAIPVRFAVEVGTFDDRAHVPAELLAMSNDQELYLAIRVAKNLSGRGNQVVLRLDGNESSTFDGGDDVVSITFWETGGAGSPAPFEDSFAWSCYPREGSGPSLCTSLDTDGWEADVASGTSDGGGAIHHGDGETIIELWHPYANGDPRDVGRAPGQTLLVDMQMSLWCGVSEEYWPCWGASGMDTFQPFVLGACTAPPPARQMVEVRIGASGAPLPVVDFDAGESSVPVTVLGSRAFDAANVDVSRLFFAGAPVARDARLAARASVEDANGDGLADLVAHFDVAEMVRASGYVELALAGRTSDGRSFYGMDGVQAVWDWNEW